MDHPPEEPLAEEDAAPPRAREQMLRSVRRHPEVDDPQVLKALRAVPRHRFVPLPLRRWAYHDRTLDLDHGQTISAPHMAAIMASLLRVRPGDDVLDVGTGSGYNAAVLAELVGPNGHVWSVEYLRPLTDRATRALEESGYGDRVTVRAGDGSQGWPEPRRFNRICVTAAAPQVPAPLLAQLADGGRLVVPVGGPECDLIVVERYGHDLRQEAHGRCLFVPLRGAHGTEASSPGPA